jgi:hypothetical protein
VPLNKSLTARRRSAIWGRTSSANRLSHRAIRGRRGRYGVSPTESTFATQFAGACCALGDAPPQRSSVRWRFHALAVRVPALLAATSRSIMSGTRRWKRATSRSSHPNRADPAGAKPRVTGPDESFDTQTLRVSSTSGPMATRVRRRTLRVAARSRMVATRDLTLWRMVGVDDFPSGVRRLLVSQVARPGAVRLVREDWRRRQQRRRLRMHGPRSLSRLVS